MVAAQPRILEWFRPDPWPKMRRILTIGPTVVLAGCLVIAVSFLTHQGFEVRAAAALAGFAVIIGGVGFTIASMHRILREEVSLVLRSDGVFVQSAKVETLVPWDDVREARWDVERAALVIERAEGSPIVLPGPRARIPGPDLAARILQHKRKVALGLP
jgi:hypothetical protein